MGTSAYKLASAEQSETQLHISMSPKYKLRIHPAANTHAITSVTMPIFRRHGLKKSPMIHTAVSGTVSMIFFGVDFRGLLISNHAESRVSGMTIDQ